VIPPSANARENAISSLVKSTDDAANATTGAASSIHFSHVREQIARASLLPVRSIFASADVSSTL
jgi:hypothetical protein